MTHRKRLALQIAMAALPLLLVAVVWWVLLEVKYRLPAPVALQPVAAHTPRDLEAVFADLGYAWPPRSSVPPVAVSAFPDGMDALPAVPRKRLFFRALLPLLLAENRLLRKRRAFVASLFARGDLERGSRPWESVRALAQRYRVDGDLNDPAVRSNLLRRLDTVPPALVLAQAANESGWGTSRFAREANNLFGVWTFRDGEGLVPRDRTNGANHLVRVFPDIRSSIRDYLFNINVGAAYAELREHRAAMRSNGDGLDPLALAGGLQRYSQRGAAYVAEIREIIRSNGLQRLEGLRLAR